MRKFIDTFTAWLTNFGIDKYIHILVVLIICGFVGQFCFLAGAARVLAGAIGFFVGMLAGFAKEAIDVKTTKQFGAGDLIADLIGAIIFFLIFIC